MGKVLDITGHRYGRLRVIEYRGIKHGSMWLCECDCGNRVVVQRSNLRSGTTKSCGCFRSEYISQKNSLPYAEASFNELLGKYRGSAAKHGRTFTLSKKQFRGIVTQRCHYCGVLPMQMLSNKHLNGNFVYNGVDRVDNRMGYTLKNVVPCCKRCNIAKRDMSQDEFYNWVHQVYGHFRGNR